MDRPSEPGALTRVRFTKYDGSPHWTFAGRWLGRDSHGDWIGYPAGTQLSRPGLDLVFDFDSVGLFPDAGWAPAFNYGHPGGIGIYVDLATVPEWHRLGDGSFEVSSTDLDLDIVVSEHRPPFIDDEDEFAEHQLIYGYPPALTARVRADAEALLRAVAAGEPPFDGPTAARWLKALRALG